MTPFGGGEGAASDFKEYWQPREQNSSTNAQAAHAAVRGLTIKHIQYAHDSKCVCRYSMHTIPSVCAG
jgi:hypothetical protein